MSTKPRTIGRHKVLPAVAIVVVLSLLVAGIGIYVGFLRPDPAKNATSTPTSTPTSDAALTGKIVWSDAMENDPFDTHPIGSWLTDTLFVRGSHSRLVAYQRKTGRRVWQLDAPPNRAVCGMATSTDNQVGALALDIQTRTVSKITEQPQRVCKDVQLVDLRTGRARWTTDFPVQPGNVEAPNAIVEVLAGVVLFQSHADLYGVAVATGERLWTSEQMKRGDDDCAAQDLLPAPTRRVFVSLWRCGLLDEPNLYTATIAPETGELGSVVDLTKGRFDPGLTASAGLVSYEPTVVVTSPAFDQPGKGSITVLDATGEPTMSIPQSGSYGLLDLSDTALPGRPPMPAAGRPRFAVSMSGRTLYAVTTHEDPLEELEENTVVALDLSTGKPRWTAKAGESTNAVLVGADEHGAIAMSIGTYENPPQVLRFAVQDGARNELGPAYARDFIGAPRSALLTWTDNQVIAVPQRKLHSVPGEPSAAVFAFG